MNLGNVPASIGSSHVGLGNHGMKSMGSCWFLKTAYCSASHDSSCSADQVLITQ